VFPCVVEFKIDRRGSAADWLTRSRQRSARALSKQAPAGGTRYVEGACRAQLDQHRTRTTILELSVSGVQQHVLCSNNIAYGASAEELQAALGELQAALGARAERR